MSRTVVQAAMVSSAAPLVCMSDTRSAVRSRISRRVSCPGRSARLASARSTWPRHSTKSDWWNQSGSADVASAIPTDLSPLGEKDPVQRRPHVVEVTAVHGQPLERGPVPLGLGSLEDDLVVLGMASGHLVELPAVGELLERVDSRGLEQAVLRVGIRDLDDDQRLRRQIRHDVDHFRRVEVVGRDDGTGRLQRETTGKNAQAVQDGALDRGSSS